MEIGGLSRLTGVSTRMLRYYEARGLLRPGRSASGYRIYSRADLQTVEHIKLLGGSGMTLDAIRRILPCSHSGKPGFTPCQEVKDGLRRQIAELDRRRSELTQSRRLLASYLAGLLEPDQRR